MKLYSFSYTLVLFFSTALSLANDVQTTQTYLPSRQSIAIPLLGRPVWIENSQVVRGKIKGPHLLLSPQKTGQSWIVQGQHAQTVHVIDSLLSAHLFDLKKKLKSLPWLKADIQNGNLIITGNLYSIAEWFQLTDLTQNFQSSAGVYFDLNTSAQVRQEINNQIADQFQRSGLPAKAIQFTSPWSMTMNSQDLYFSVIKKRMNKLGVEVKTDSRLSFLEPSVRIEVTIAEVKKNRSLKYGVQWPAQWPQSSTEQESLISLSALEAEGDGQILAQPILSCRSGEQADFFSGGEFPIKILNYRVQDIVWKKYGVQLKIKPVLKPSSLIQVSIETEISTLDDSIKVDNIPGIKTHKVSTHFDLRNHQTLALTGLLKIEKGFSWEGLPGLSQLPIVGSLFSSKDFRQNKTELVIFVTPHLL